MNSTFKIIGIFSITNRGIVLMGNIIDGTIFIGDDITFLVGEDIITRSIIGIEAPRTVPPSDKIGLLIKYNTDEIKNIKNNWKPNDTISIITKPDKDETINN